MPLLTRPPSRRPGPVLSRAAAGLSSVEGVAVARAAVGSALLVRPRLLAQSLGVDSAANARMSWAVQMLGAREVALGLGTLAALRGGAGRGLRLWLMAGLLADATDAVVVWAAVGRGRLSRGSGTVLVAVAGAAAALQAKAVASPSSRQI